MQMIPVVIDFICSDQKVNVPRKHHCFRIQPMGKFLQLYFFFILIYILLQMAILKTVNFINCEHVLNQITLNGIKEKVYQNFRQLRMDILWFVHNCHTIFRREEGVVKPASQLVQLLDDEIFNLKVCISCYKLAQLNPDSSFTMPCGVLHPYMAIL